MKVFRILVVTLLALLMAAPAFAINVKLKGDFREFFRYTNQAQLFNQDASDYDTKKNSNDSDFRFSQRLRLTWVMEDDEKKVRGTFGAEFDVTAGQRGGGTRNGPGGNFEGDRTNFELRLVYIDFEVPFDPMTRAYIGLQPAEMNAWVFCDNAMGVRLAREMGNLLAAIAWFRNDTPGDDNSGWGGDDKSEYGDLFTLDLKYDLGAGNKLGAFAYYHDDGQTPNYSQSNQWPIPGVYWDDSTQTYWLGLEGAFEAGNFFGGFTAIYQGGTANDSVMGDMDISAYLLNVEGTVKLGKAYATLGWAYASGDDDLGDDDVENYTSIDTDNSLLGSVALLEFWDWNAALYGPFVGYLGMNHVYLNVGYEFNEKTDGRLGFIWFNTAEDTPFGNDNIGYEINGELNYAITENLTAGIAAGYLIGDDVWDDLASDGDAEDLWNVISRIRFKF